MAKDGEAEELLPGETEIQADSLGRTLLMRIAFSMTAIALDNGTTV